MSPWCLEKDVEEGKRGRPRRQIATVLYSIASKNNNGILTLPPSPLQSGHLVHTTGMSDALSSCVTCRDARVVHHTAQGDTRGLHCQQCNTSHDETN